MFCGKCGKMAEAGEKFCKHCGESLGAGDASAEKPSPALTGSWFIRAKDVNPGPATDPVDNDLYDNPASHTPRFYIPNDLTDTPHGKKYEDHPATRRRSSPKYPAHEKSRSKRDQLFNRSPRLRVENILRTKKWVFSLIPTVYSGFFTVVALISSNAAIGIVALISGIMSTLVLRRIDAAYKAYKINRVCPEDKI